MKSLRKALEIFAIISAIFVLVTVAGALTYVNLKVIFTVSDMAEEHRRRVEVIEMERARANHVLDQIERHLKQLDGKLGRPIGPKK